MNEKHSYRPGLGRNLPLVQQLKEFQRNPRSLVFVSLAEAYRAEGLAAQALEILAEGLVFHPGLASAILVRARCLFDLRRYAEASEVVRSAIAQNPDNLRAHKLQAEIFVRLGQRKAAIRALAKVVLLFPQDIEAVRALEELENIESKQNIPIQNISRASVDLPPATGKIEEFQVGSFGESLAEISRAPHAGPVDHRQNIIEPEDDGQEPTFATRTIAELYLRQGLKAKAGRVLRKILAEDQGNAWARETLQVLESDGIVLRTSSVPKPKPSTALSDRASALERMLARVRLLKRIGA
ncbi:MAG: tetratricopeptide repeat protein [Bdellovibrionota bacterium]